MAAVGGVQPQPPGAKCQILTIRLPAADAWQPPPWSDLPPKNGESVRVFERQGGREVTNLADLVCLTIFFRKSPSLRQDHNQERRQNGAKHYNSKAVDRRHQTETSLDRERAYC